MRKQPINSMFILDIEYIHKSVEITFSKADNVYCARLPDKRIEMFQEKNLQTAFTHSPDGGLKLSNVIVIVGSLRKKPRDNLTRGSDGGLGPFRCVSRKSPPFLQSRPKNVTESGSEAGLVRCFTEPSRQISDESMP